MANPEHLAILEQGVEVWNRWRGENPDIRPDITGAYLEVADLDEFNLSEADLYRTNLYEARLRNANLSWADLTEANLSATELDGANLYAASLFRANLLGANLIKSNLYGTNFSENNLIAVTFDKAICGYTIFAFNDLGETNGLDTIIHQAPSEIGIDTLNKSQGNIPEAFLRGCGVPDQMIEYAKSLKSSPIKYYSCFISYSQKNDEFAQRLYNDLQAAGVRCWFAPHDMKIGDKIRPMIDESIRVHDKTLLILSEHSVQSDWVEHEVEHALDIEKERKKNVLFPVRVDEAVMESKTGWAGNVRRQRHIGDFTRWKDHDAYLTAFERLLQDLKAG